MNNPLSNLRKRLVEWRDRLFCKLVVDDPECQQTEELTVAHEPPVVDDKISIKTALNRIEESYLERSVYDVSKRRFVERVDLARPLEWLWELIDSCIDEKAEFSLARNIHTINQLSEELREANPFRVKKEIGPDHKIGNCRSESDQYDTDKIYVRLKWLAAIFPVFVQEIETNYRLTESDKAFLDFVKRQGGKVIAPTLFRADDMKRGNLPRP